MTDESSASSPAAPVGVASTPAATDPDPNPWFAAAMIIGVVLLMLGVGVLWVGVANAAEYSPDGGVHVDDGVGETIWGIVSLGGGVLLATAALVIGGIEWILRNRAALRSQR